MATMKKNDSIEKDVSAITSNLVALASGLLFGIGLTISTMVDPSRVIGFLDIFGQWDPTLTFVMFGAIGVYMPLYWIFINPKNKTVFDSSLYLPNKTDIDKPLIYGAIIFGMGWGISGMCPGPAITNLTSGNLTILGFVLAMVLGMLVASKVNKTSG